jgi:glycosyltransferase involved in cell wall biosynthesis
MRLLQLGPWPPPNGGVQTNIVSIREMLLRRGHECMVINLHRHRTGREPGVYHPTSGKETFALLRSLQYDIIHLHIGGSVPGRLLALAAACTAMPGARSVLTFHSGGYATSPEGRAARPLSARGLVFRRFDRIIAVNQEIVQLFERFGVPSGRIRLIHPHALPSSVPATRLLERASAFFAAHSPVLLTVGLLEPEYDLELQINALGRIRERYPRAGLLIAGSGSREAALRSEIASKSWAEHVLLYGDMPHDTALRAIWEAGVFLRTTLYDGDSVAVREALHFGTPVLATDNGMRPEGVHLFPVGDIDALCAALERVLSEPRSREIRPGAAEANIEAVLDLYTEIGASGGHSAVVEQII